jgi:hypothetical protein
MLKRFLFILLILIASCKAPVPIIEQAIVVADTSLVEMRDIIADTSYEVSEIINTELSMAGLESNITPGIISYIIENPSETQSTEIVLQPTYTSGIVTYKVSDTMYVDEVTTVNLTISTKEITKKIVNEIGTFSTYNITSERIRIAKQMKVELIDGSNENFKVINITNSTQIVEDFGYTRWEWAVTPLKKGYNPLKLTIYIVFENGGNKIEKVYKNFINVYTHETVFQSVRKFLLENWEFFTGSVIIPLFIFFYMRKKKKKKK